MRRTHLSGFAAVVNEDGSVELDLGRQVLTCEDIYEAAEIAAERRESVKRRFSRGRFGVARAA